MQSHLSNPWNYAVAFLAMYCEEERLATGSCFFWGLNGKTFLVTNWHNLTGRNPLTNELMSRTGAIPDRIDFIAFKRVSEPDADGFFELNVMPVKVELFDALSNPQWFEHPTLGQKVDIAAIDITQSSRDSRSNTQTYSKVTRCWMLPHRRMFLLLDSRLD